MATVKVTGIVDGDTFTIYPSVKFKGFSYSTIRPSDYNTPERNQAGYQAAKLKLHNLIYGKHVQITKGIKPHGNRLVCEVYYNGRKLGVYFK